MFQFNLSTTTAGIFSSLIAATLLVLYFDTTLWQEGVYFIFFFLIFSFTVLFKGLGMGKISKNSGGHGKGTWIGVSGFCSIYFTV